MNNLTVGSLFSGIGGIDLGLEQTGRFEIAWQVEIDPYCQKVLEKHWPNVARYGDVCAVGKHNLSRVDVLAGGFPCQDISSAGKRAGITGELSGLWSEFYRLICELRPKYVLVENVAALLYPIKRKRSKRIIGIEPAPIGRVLGDLAEVGYDAEWEIISASAIGALHQRERAFVVAYATSCGLEECQETSWVSTQFSSPGHDVSNSTGERCLWRQHESLSRQHECTTLISQNGNREQMANPDRQGLAVGEVFGSYAAAQLSTAKRSCSTGGGIWATESDVGRVVDGVSSRVDRLRGLGNAVVPQVARYIGECIIAYEDVLQTL